MSAEAIRAQVEARNFWEARTAVKRAVIEGRVTYLPAGARLNDTARVLVDGEDVGPASVLMHGLRAVPDGTRFGVQRVVARGW